MNHDEQTIQAAELYHKQTDKAYPRRDFLAGAEYAFSRWWIPVGERLPEEDDDEESSADVFISGDIYVHGEFHFKGVTIGWTRKGKWGHILPEKQEVKNITHWMPLPELPQP